MRGRGGGGRERVQPPSPHTNSTVLPPPRRRPPRAGKWARGPWAGSDAQETQVKEETQATLRCFPFAQPAHSGRCLMTGEPAAEVAIFAKAY